MKLIRYFLLCILAFAAMLISCGEVENNVDSSFSQSILEAISETGKYTAKDSVATYIHLFRKLPSNYVNKVALKIWQVAAE
jgi:hypothetical protein